MKKEIPVICLSVEIKDEENWNNFVKKWLELLKENAEENRNLIEMLTDPTFYEDDIKPYLERNEFVPLASMTYEEAIDSMSDETKRGTLSIKEIQTIIDTINEDYAFVVHKGFRKL